MSGEEKIATLSEGDWDSLVSRIKKGECTPFLGAGISAGVIPTGSEIAAQWAQDKRFLYPLPEKSDLIKVAQYIALTIDPSYPKELLQDIIQKSGSPDFDDPAEPHTVLAGLPLPLYITTNYDDFMYQALSRQKDKKPEIFISRWNEPAGTPAVVGASPASNVPFGSLDMNPTIEKPAVYHFHGHKDHTGTMVLTEDDYLDFLINISRDPSLIPPRIQQALAGTSLLFIGYSLNDTNFRVVFRSLVEYTKRSVKKKSVTVQIPSKDARVVDYLTKYFENSGIRVYWGDARRFVAELRDHWTKAHD